MNIGPLNTRARIERPVTTTDPDYGSDDITWELVGTFWIGLQDQLPSRAESNTNGIEISNNLTRMRCRHTASIDSSMRVIVNRPTQKIYKIISGPAVLGDKDGLEFMLELSSS